MSASSYNMLLNSAWRSLTPKPSGDPSSSHPRPATPPDVPIFIHRTHLYPKHLWEFLGGFIFVVAVFQFVSFLHARYHRQGRSSEASDPEATSVPVNRGFSLRRIPVAIVNAYRVVAFRWTLNIGQSYTLNLAEVLLTVIYIIAMFTWSFVNTTNLAGQKLTPSYWAGRAGVLASSQFPLITALGTKNNVISFITGISYDKLNYLHRMTARVAFILVWVHGGANLKRGIPGHVWHDTWIQSGMLGTTALALLCLISIRPARAKAYEFFFYTHFVMVVIFLVTAYYHTLPFKFDYYIWPSFIIWGLDRLLRAIRLVIFNHSYFGFKSGSGTLDAQTELLSEGLVRLTLRRPPHFHWLPGQTAYLIMPSVSALPFESHPFTIASFDSSLERKKSSEKDMSSQDEKGSDDSTPFWKELVFLINARGGCTSRLANIAAKHGTIKVFVDGPYGPSPDLGRFNTSVLIAGGSGVSYTLPVLLDIIERVSCGKSDCARVVFIWAIRDGSHIRWISDALSKALLLVPSSLSVEIRIFITGCNLDSVEWDDDAIPSQSESEGSIKVIETRGPTSLFNFSAVSLAEGRPDLHAMLRQLVEETTGRMSVSVCGSQAVARAVRSALRFPVSSPKSVLQGGASVSLYVESFGYA